MARRLWGVVRLFRGGDDNINSLNPVLFLMTTDRKLQVGEMDVVNQRPKGRRVFLCAQQNVSGETILGTFRESSCVLFLPSIAVARCGTLERE